MSLVLSSLLSTREKAVIFNLLSSECSALASAVVQLFLATTASKGKKSNWQIHSCGVVCLVQDKKSHSTFIRLFSVKKANLLWEQEMYTPFTYSTPCPFFHTFPTDECWAGLNFCDEDEASRFHEAVHNFISNTKARPAFVRTHSLDSVSGRLLREKINKCLSLGRSFQDPSSVHSDETQTLSLAQRKGPLPPIPVSKHPVRSVSPQGDLSTETPSIPLPPPFPLNIKKSVSFSPGGNYNNVEKPIMLQRLNDDA